MKFVLVGIALAAGAYFAVQTPASRHLLMQLKVSASALASQITGNLTR